MHGGRISLHMAPGFLLMKSRKTMGEDVEKEAEDGDKGGKSETIPLW